MSQPRDPTTIEAVDPLAGLEYSYAGLPEHFYARVEPTPVATPELLRLNVPLCRSLGLDPEHLAAPEGVAALAGNRIPPGGEPLAMAYAGHQFGGFVPSLGDGRAVLLGEIIAPDGTRHDLHLKGAGRTPFSRAGDGRAPLGPVVREYIVSEAMAGLGIPTTRALAMVTTGERVYRERPEPGAVLARTATSHVRVGTFEYFYRRGDAASVRKLADYVIDRHYPHCREASNPYNALLDEVVAGQAGLIAKWMLVGFIHGVMNTDNMSVAAQTIDYGPCAFMDTYRSDAVYSSIDWGGRYAYDSQPRIGFWNLARFAECLLGLLDGDAEKAKASARQSLEAFATRFEAAFHGGMCAKVGLDESRAENTELAFDLLDRMARQEADFTNTFRALCADAAGPRDKAAARLEFADPAVFDEWAAKWRRHLDEQRRRSGRDAASTMRSVNPAHIPRNHRVQQVIDAIERDRDLQPLEELLTVVSRPFDAHPGLEDLARPPRPEEVVARTFCGT